MTRDDIRQRLWPSDTFVDFEHSLNTSIKKLREALGEEAGRPHCIETLARRGYRFIGNAEPIREIPASPIASPIKESCSQVLAGKIGDAPVPAPSPTDAAPTAIGNPYRVRLMGVGQIREPLPARRWPVWLEVMAAMLLAGMAVGWFVRHQVGPHATHVAPGTIRSLAILPLENLSRDPDQEYFADGMTEQLITNLGQIGALRVISRTSAMQYKRTKKPLPQIAHELNVDAMVEGAILRSGDRLRITTQLIHASPDRHL